MSSSHLPFVLITALVCTTLVAPQATGQEPTPSPQAKPTVAFEIPPAAAQKANPVKATPESVEAGKRLFATQCVMCHGVGGDGKGDLAVELKWEVKDWRNPEALKGMTDGALFYILAKGRGHMPDQESRMSDAQKWNLVNFIRSLARHGEETRKEEKKPEAKQP